MKKVIKASAIAVTVLGIAASAQAADYAINLVGASAQSKFWNVSATSWLSDSNGMNCASVVQYGDQDNGAAVGTTCSPAAGTNITLASGDRVVLRYRAQASIFGPKSANGELIIDADNYSDLDLAATDLDGNGLLDDPLPCGAGQFALIDVDRGTPAATGNNACFNITYGSSDVSGEAFVQKSVGYIKGPNSDTYDYIGGGDPTDSYYDPGENEYNVYDTSNLDNVRPVVVPFSFFITEDVQNVDADADPSNDSITRLQAVLAFSGTVTNWEDIGIDANNDGFLPCPAGGVYDPFGGLAVEPLTCTDGERIDCTTLQVRCPADPGYGVDGEGNPIVVPFDPDGAGSLPAVDCTAENELLPVSGTNYDGFTCTSDYENAYIVNPAATDTQMTVCLRHAGSGTHATLDHAIFHGDSKVKFEEDIYGSNGPIVWFNEGSSDLTRCMSYGGTGHGSGGPGEWADATTYAIGYADGDKCGIEKSEDLATAAGHGWSSKCFDGGQKIRRINYQGVEGTRENIKHCVYPFFAEQYLYFDPTEVDPNHPTTTLDYVHKNLSDYMGNPANLDNLPGDQSLKYFWAARDEMKCTKDTDYDFPRKK